MAWRRGRPWETAKSGQEGWQSSRPQASPGSGQSASQAESAGQPRNPLSTHPRGAQKTTPFLVRATSTQATRSLYAFTTNQNILILGSVTLLAWLWPRTKGVAWSGECGVEVGAGGELGGRRPSLAELTHTQAQVRSRCGPPCSGSPTAPERPWIGAAAVCSGAGREEPHPCSCAGPSGQLLGFNSSSDRGSPEHCSPMAVGMDTRSPQAAGVPLPVPPQRAGALQNHHTEHAWTSVCTPEPKGAAR